MTQTISSLLRTKNRSVRLPSAMPSFEAAAAAAISGEDRELIEPLMAGLHGDLVVEQDRVQDVFGVTPTSFEDAARAAIEAMD